MRGSSSTWLHMADVCFETTGPAVGVGEMQSSLATRVWERPNHIPIRGGAGGGVQECRVQHILYYCLDSALQM